MLLPELTDFHFDSLGSTNDYATELLNSHNLVAVTASEQTAGRGRRGAEWVGDKGKNIYLSFGINHQALVDDNYQPFRSIPPYGQQMAAALLAIDVLRKLAKGTYSLKYPNDLYLSGYSSAEGSDIAGKLGGIITEHSYQGDKCTTSVIGIGINVSQQDFPPLKDNTPISVNMVEGNVLSPDELIEKMKAEFIRHFTRSYDDVYSEWKRELRIIGKRVLIKDSQKEAKIISITSDGRLIAESGNDTISIDDGNSIRYDVFG